MTVRRRPTKAQKAAVLALQAGMCGCGCGEPLAPPVEWDHSLPLALGGDNGDGNWSALRAACHRLKTAADVGRIRKADRQRKKHLGLSAARKTIPSRPFNRRFRKRMDGTVEARP